MEYQKKGGLYFLRADRGEEILAVLKQFCEKEQIALGFVSGIGAVGRIKMGLFKTGEKRYVCKESTGEFEIVSLTGTITRMDGAPYLHLHIAAADESGVVRGGHLNEAEVSATAELVVFPGSGAVGREFSEEIGLNLFQF